MPGPSPVQVLGARSDRNQLGAVRTEHDFAADAVATISDFLGIGRQGSGLRDWFQNRNGLTQGASAQSGSGNNELHSLQPTAEPEPVAEDPRRSDVSSLRISQHVDILRSSRHDVGGFLPTTNDGEWACQICTCINVPKAEACCVCDTPRGSAQPPPSLCGSQRFAGGAAATPLYECITCMDNLRIEDMFIVECKESHKYCFECIRGYVERTICVEKRIPRCPMCPYTLSLTEVKQLFPGTNSAVAECYLEVSLKNLLASDASYLACPTPGCVQYLAVPLNHTSSDRHKVDCPACGMTFCSACKGLYHYGLSWYALRLYEFLACPISFIGDLWIEQFLVAVQRRAGDCNKALVQVASRGARSVSSSG
eukprot:SAG31_NODE_6536_length_1985_cov_1.817603_1_plen_367_part_00